MYAIQTSPERKLKLCALPTCKGKRYDLVHKFPMNNERAQQWIDMVDLPELRKLPIDQIRKRFFICSKHFRPQDYKNCESRSLNTTAYPRLHLRLRDDEAVEQCTSNVNVEEVGAQECDYGIQETTIEFAEPQTADKKPASLEYIVCSTIEDPPVLLTRSRNDAEVVLQKTVRVHTPVTIKSSPKSIDSNTSIPNSDPNKFILKRTSQYIVEPVRKKLILNESDKTKTYCNASQINLKCLCYIPFLVTYMFIYGLFLL